jgi:hypothetical protein
VIEDSAKKGKRPLYLSFTFRGLPRTRTKHTKREASPFLPFLTRFSNITTPQNKREASPLPKSRSQKRIFTTKQGQRFIPAPRISLFCFHHQRESHSHAKRNPLKLAPMGSVPFAIISRSKKSSRTKFQSEAAKLNALSPK